MRQSRFGSSAKAVENPSTRLIAAREEVTIGFAFGAPNDIEFSGEKEGAQRLTPSPLQ